MDEFWRLLADPAFESFAKDGPKTWRKLNGVMCLATQSPSDVLDSPISRTLVEQTPTKIFFPNADADFEEYTRGFGLTEREFRLIKDQLEPGSRMFLVKQSHHSVVCQLDLKGFDAELAVISGRAARSNACTRSSPRPAQTRRPGFPVSGPKHTIERRLPCVSAIFAWSQSALVVSMAIIAPAPGAMGSGRCAGHRTADPTSAATGTAGHRAQPVSPPSRRFRP